MKVGWIQIHLHGGANRRGIIIVGSGGVEDGEVRHEHHFSPKYIKNASACGISPTEHLLNTCRSPQSSKKANQTAHKVLGKRQ